MPVRKALGIPTIFNLLGPLTNPAGAGRQLMGVYARDFVRLIAESLVRLGSTRALVFHSDDGLDEISIGALTHVAEVRNGRVRDWTVDPAALGLEMADPMSLAPVSLDEAAELLLRVLRGEDRGPRRSMVLLNAAGALLAADRVENLEDGVRTAADAIDKGLAHAKLRELCELSQGE